MYKHISNLNLSTMSFKKLYIESYDSYAVAYSMKHCPVCGKVYRITKAGEHATCCSTDTVHITEDKKDSLIRDFCVWHNINMSSIIRLEVVGHVTAHVVSLLIEKKIMPIGTFTDGACWAVVGSTTATMSVFFSTVGACAGYGHYLFSDTYFRNDALLTCVYDNTYQSTCKGDGGANIIARSLVEGMLTNEETPSRIQFRLLGKDKEVFAKGTCTVMEDNNPKLLGKNFVVSSNSIKVGSIEEGTEFLATVLLSKTESGKRRRGMPGWELISFLKDVPEVHSYLNSRLGEKVAFLASSLFDNNKEGLNELLYNPMKSEKDQSWAAQIVRSSLPLDTEFTGKHLSQMFLSRCADLVMGSGIETDLHIAKCEDWLNNSALTNTAIRMPFVGGLDALIPCTKSGRYKESSMTNQTGLDDDGDDLHILDEMDADFLKKYLIKTETINSTFSGEKIKTRVSIESMAWKLMYMAQSPSIGLGVNNMAYCLANDRPELANRGGSLAHFAAQGIKKTLTDRNGKSVDTATFIDSFGMPMIPDDYTDIARDWYRSIEEKKKAGETLTITDFLKYIDMYDPHIHVGILARRIYEGCIIVRDIWNDYGMLEYAWAKPTPLSDVDKAKISNIKGWWGSRQRAFVDMKGWCHKTVLSKLRNEFYGMYREYGETIDDDTCKIIIMDSLVSGKSYMAEKLLPKAIGDYLGFATFLIERI